MLTDNKKIILYKVSYREFSGSIFKKYHDIATDDVNKIYEQFRLQKELEIKPLKPIEII